jgi:hypothetical protein
MYRSPAFERSIISAFPVRELRVDHHARLKLKAERGLILKADFNDVVVRGNVQFDALNDLAFGLWKRLNALVGFLFGTLFNSHIRLSLEGGLWSGLRSWSHTARPDSFLEGIA